MKIFYLWMLLVISLSCRWLSQPDSDEKLDARLRHIVASGDTLIHFSGKCYQTIDASIEQKMEQVNIQIISIIGHHFTARGNAKAVRQLAGLDIIERLQAGRKLKTKQKQ